MRTSLPALLVLIAASTARAEERATLELAKWETTRSPRDGAPGKYAASAPRLGFAGGQEDVHARCVFDLPAELASRSLTLVLERVRWDAQVDLDGAVLGTGLEGDPRIDLPALAPGKHEVHVRARDLRAASAIGKRGGDDDPEGAWCLPTGPRPRLAGVLGKARIEERLPVRVRSVWARGGVLHLELRGDTGEICDVGYVYSGSARTETVRVASGDSGEVAIAWPECPRWPERASVALVVSGVVERRLELASSAVETKDGRLVINGAPVFAAILDAPPGEAKDAIARAREVGATVLATTGFRDDAWFEAVEASGLLVLVDSNLAEPVSANAVEDVRLWRGLDREWRETVARLRGRACVLGWSVARGILREGGAASPTLRARLAALGDLVRSLDPTRPVLLAHDDARALGFDLPYSAAWSPGVVAVIPPLEPPATFAERLQLARDPGFLDVATVTTAHLHERARAVREARVAGALGVDLGAAAPDHELRSALGPVALACEPAPGGGDFAQRPLRRRILADQDVAFLWTLSLAGKPVASGGGSGRSVLVETVPPPVHERTPATLSVSATSSRGAGSLDVPLVVWPARLAPLESNRRVLLVDGPEGSTGEALVSAGIAWREAPAFPESLEKDTVLVLGEGTLDEQKERLRLAPFVERARRIGASVVVLRQAHNYPDGVAPPLDGFEPRGGRDLALREPLDPLVSEIKSEDLEGWAGLEGALPPPSIKRPLRADARVLVEATPLGLLEGCGVVSVEDASAPELLCQIPLAARARTVPAARALLRALIREASEPRARVARPFFARCDTDLEAELEQLALVSRPWNLDELEKAAAPVIIIDDTKSPLTDAERAALERAVSGGATVLAHVPVDAAIERLGRLAPPGWRIEKPASLPVPFALASLHASDLLWPTGPGGFRDFTQRFDATPRCLRADGTIELVKPGCVVEQPRGRGRVVLDLVRWREAGQIPQAKRFIAQLLAQLGAERKEPPIRLPVTTWGGVGREGDHIMFYGNSTASARFVARRAGRYKVRVELGGTKAHGGYPVARVVCDARHLGDVEVDGPGPKAYDLEVTIPAGVHVLNVSFTNDVYDPPEDRNMTLRGAILELAPTRIY